MNVAQNKAAVTWLIWKTKPEIAVFTETWLQHELKVANDYDHYFSPRHRYQGILILTKRNLKFLPWKHQLWDQHFTILKNSKTAIIGVYV